MGFLEKKMPFQSFYKKYSCFNIIINKMLIIIWHHGIDIFFCLQTLDHASGKLYYKFGLTVILNETVLKHKREVTKQVSNFVKLESKHNT